MPTQMEGAGAGDKLGVSVETENYFCVEVTSGKGVETEKVSLT